MYDDITADNKGLSICSTYGESWSHEVLPRYVHNFTYVIDNAW